ncbi:unnamed protein product [Urochloa humidicola]
MGLVRRWLELRRPSLAVAAIDVALFVELVFWYGDSKASLNKIKPPLSPTSSSFIRMLRCHRRPLLPILHWAPCQSRATTSRFIAAAQIRLHLQSPQPIKHLLRLLPPIVFLTFILLRQAPCALAGVLMEEGSFAADVVASLVLAGIAAPLLLVAVLCCPLCLWLLPTALAWVRQLEWAVGHACAYPSRLRRWSPFESSSGGRCSWDPPGFSSSTWSVRRWWSTMWAPPSIHASLIASRWLVAIKFQWYVSHMQKFRADVLIPGSCFKMGKGTSYEYSVVCTLLSDKYGSGNTPLNVRADLRLLSMLVLRFNVKRSRVNVLSPVKVIRYLRLKISNPHRHRPVRQSRGAPAVLSECNKEDLTYF